MKGRLRTLGDTRREEGNKENKGVIKKKKSESWQRKPQDTAGDMPVHIAGSRAVSQATTNTKTFLNTPKVSARYHEKRLHSATIQAQA